MNDKDYLRMAINLAFKSAKKGADPFGAILIYNKKVVAKSTDKSVEKSDPTYHAELGLISGYCRKKKIFSLEGHTLYSSSEPCAMCSGAIHWAKISRVVFSVSQRRLQKYSGGNKKPSCKSIINTGNNKTEIVGPLLPEEGIKIFETYPLVRKKERHKKRFGK